jgi:hypothetical protein
MPAAWLLPDQPHEHFSSSIFRSRRCHPRNGSRERAVGVLERLTPCRIFASPSVLGEANVAADRGRPLLRLPGFAGRLALALAAAALRSLRTSVTPRFNRPKITASRIFTGLNELTWQYS